jgi:hypothetical protein
VVGQPNVWSAALSQAKNEVMGWSAQMYSAFVGAQGGYAEWSRTVDYFSCRFSNGSCRSTGFGAKPFKFRPAR